MAPLVDDVERQLPVLERLEALTSRRRDLDTPLLAGRKRSEFLAEAHGYGWTWIDAAFCYTRPTGNRFNAPDRGAWYAAWGQAAVATAQAEVVWHLTRELGNAGVRENITDYRELIAGFTMRMADLRGMQGEPCLDPDAAVACPAGQEIARALRRAGVSGVVYRSCRRAGGPCLAAFRPNLVQNIRQGATWRFTWDGDRVPGIIAI